MEGREYDDQLKGVWASLISPEWECDSSPEDLEDLLQWAPPDQQISGASFLPSDMDFSPDDLLPSMQSLMEASDVSGNTAFAASCAADSADSSLFCFLDASGALFEAQLKTEPCSVSFPSTPGTAAVLPLPRNIPAGLPPPDTCGATTAPELAQKVNGSCELRIAAMQNTGFTVPCQKGNMGMPAIPSGPFIAPSWGSADVCGQLDAWTSGNSGGFSSLELNEDRKLSPERMGSTASNDSSSFTQALARVVPAASVLAKHASRVSSRHIQISMEPSIAPSFHLAPARGVSPSGRQIRRSVGRPATAAGNRARPRAPADPDYTPAAAGAAAWRPIRTVTAAQIRPPRPCAAPKPAPRQVSPVSAARAAAAERNRQVQREYLNRKQAKEQAVHAQVGELEARRAQLQAQLAPLLARHEHLSRSLPWHKQQEEWGFMASIASCVPGGADVAAMSAQATTPDLLQRMMLEPDATVEQLYSSAGIHSYAEDNAAPLKPLCLAPSSQHIHTPGSSFDAAPWRRLVARMRLTKAQREGIAAGYERHVQSEAFLHQDCLGIAASLQMVPTLGGALTDSLRPNLATQAMSSQLAGIARRGDALTQQLIHTCFQVLKKPQMEMVRQLASTLALDMRALCREVAAASPKRTHDISGVCTGFTGQAGSSRKRTASRELKAGPGDASEDMAGDIAGGNAPGDVPRKRRSAGPPPRQSGCSS